MYTFGSWIFAVLPETASTGERMIRKKSSFFNGEGYVG
jgi:hypothetical protein